MCRHYKSNVNANQYPRIEALIYHMAFPSNA